MSAQRFYAVGIDAAFANMGFASVTIDITAAGEIVIRPNKFTLASTEKESGKTVRVSSDRLRRANELRAAMVTACAGAAFAFVEVPSGTQSAQSAFGLGIAVGVLSACPVPIIEVNPMEVKAAVAGKRVRKGATKAEVIAWAHAKWPAAPWIRADHRATVKGKTLPAGRLTNDNEHLADAMATVVAGVATPEFRRLIQLQAHANAIPDAADERPPFRRRAELRVPMGRDPLAR